MMILPALLALAPGGVHVTVVGEGKLRFAVGRKVSTSTEATLSANAQGLLVNEFGLPVTPAIRVPAGALKIAMNGTVSVGSKTIDRLVLERPGKGAVEIGYPGEDGFAILKIDATNAPATPAPSRTTTGAAQAASNATKSATVRITIHPTNELEGERAKLGDIADIEADAETTGRLAKLDVGSVPEIGGRRTLGKWTVTSVLRDAGFKTVELNFPPDVTIRRKGQTIDVDTLVAKAKEAAGESAVLTSAPGLLAAPMGETTFQAVAKHGESDLFTVTVTVLVDGKSVGTRTVGFRDRTPGIRTGETVKVVMLKAGASIELEGKAKNSGRTGSVIQVTMTDGTVLDATVTGPGQVEVKL